MESRADRIYKILLKDGPRLKVQEIRAKLAKVEKVELEELVPAVVSATVSYDNLSRTDAGRVKRFRCYGDGDEEHGYVSLFKAEKIKYSKADIISNYESSIPSLIEEANDSVREQLKKAIAELTWRQFETNFLVQVLEALGFNSVEVTQATKDGGTDAFCTYRRGLVVSTAIVSAKHWKSANVPAAEIQRLRGIKSDADTGIIITSSGFTADAVKEAVPGQNIRSIVLIDSSLIVDTCLSSSIGIRLVETPQLYKFVGFTSESDARP
jgi:hypothetical protein